MAKVKKDEVAASTVEETQYVVPPTYDEDGVQATSGIDEEGREHPDPFPTAPPVGYQAPPDLYWMIRNMVRSEAIRAAAEQEGFDTFEEAEDFDVEDDDVEVRTEYEKVFDPPPPTAQPITQSVGGNGAAVPPAAPAAVSSSGALPVQRTGEQAVDGRQGISVQDRDRNEAAKAS